MTGPPAGHRYVEVGQRLTLGAGEGVDAGGGALEHPTGLLGDRCRRFLERRSLQQQGLAGLPIAEALG